MSDFSSTILPMRLALFALLFAAFAEASAQRGVLASPLPAELSDERALEVARQALTARGWTVLPQDRSNIEAERDGYAMRVFIGDKGLLFRDEAVQRGRGSRQRNREDNARSLTAVPQPEIDALRIDLAAAFAGKPPVAGGTPLPRPTGQILIAVPPGADPGEAMKVAREAFVGRRWSVKDDADGAFVADIRGSQESATLKVFVADGALRFIDRSTDRNGARARVPERWLNNLRAD